SRAELRSGLSFIGILLMALVVVVVAVAVIAAAALPHIGVYRRFSAPPLRGFRFIFPLDDVTVTGRQAAVFDGRPVVRFVAWRPVWYKRIKRGPTAPTLRIRRKRPTIIGIESTQQSDDLPWEQWLGQSYPPSQRANLLYFRDERWRTSPTRHVDWSRATYAYQGPAHILGVTPLPEGNARALHLIGT